MKKIKITKRDRELMKWVNGVGFAKINQIAEKMGISKWAAYKRVNKLAHNGYLEYQRFYHDLSGVCTVTEMGVEYAGSYLPPLKSIAKGTYDHDLLVTDILIKLQKKHQGEFTTEREFRYQKNQDGIGQFGHVPDAEILIDNKKIAIEVELNKKGSRRLQKIMNEYMKNFDISEVWYFCATNEIKRQISEYQSGFSFLKVFDLDDCLK